MSMSDDLTTDTDAGTETDGASASAFDDALAALATPHDDAPPVVEQFDETTPVEPVPVDEALTLEESVGAVVEDEPAAAEPSEAADDFLEELTEAGTDDDLLDPALLAGAELVGVTEAQPTIESPFDRPGAWYIVHTYAGYENKVKQNLASRVKSMAVEDKIFEVVIPMEEVIEFKGGKKHVVSKKLFPGYLYIRMELDDESWYVVRNTPGVTGFVGGGAKPVPLTRKAVEDVLGVPKFDEEGAVTTEKKVRPRLEYDIGEQVRVVTGPFADFNGVISEIDVDRSKLKVLVNIFGRETPVELEFGDVAKL
jgi:transcriptional antiterminator NusG